MEAKNRANADLAVTMRKPGVAFFPAHPSQLWMLRPVAQALDDRARVCWILRDKDCTVELARSFGLEFHVISHAGRGLLGNAREFIADLRRAVRLARELDIDLWVTKYGAANIAARLTGRESVSFNDDDADVVPLIAWTSYPFSRAVLAPSVTRMGRFERKTLRYDGYHELCYLHPDRFTPDPGVLDELGIRTGEPFALIRLSALQSHHDTHARGLGVGLVQRVIRLAEVHRPPIRVFLSSEGPLEAPLESYRMPVAPDRVHHALAFAEFLVGDSQTMTAEAAVLGTPAFRFSSFVGRISYLDELERYGLAFGFRPDEPDQLVAELQGVLSLENRQAIFETRRQTMLSQKIDPVPWMTNVLEAMLSGERPEP
jgi:predicted glycosyltransferase